MSAYEEEPCGQVRFKSQLTNPAFRCMVKTRAALCEGSAVSYLAWLALRQEIRLSFGSEFMFQRAACRTGPQVSCDLRAPDGICARTGVIPTVRALAVRQRASAAT